MTTPRLSVVGRLTAAEDRRLKGWLLPFGRPGQTNAGRVVANPGALEVPPVDRLFASLDHLDGRDEVATFALVEERPEGLWAEWDVPETHGGDRLLAEYRAGARTGISVEVEPYTVRDGVMTGTLVGCAFPVRPAFPDARLVAELAADTPAEDLEEAARILETARGLYYSQPTAGPWEDLDDATRAGLLEVARAAVAALPAPAAPADLEVLHAEAAPTLTPATCVHADGSEHPAPTDSDGTAALCDDAATGPAPTPETPDAAGAGDTPSTGDTVTTPLLAGAAAAPAGLAPSTPPAGAPSRLLAADTAAADLWQLLGEASRDTSARARLLAALVDIVPANTLDRDQPQWLDELWSGNAYQRRIVPLLTGGDLTDLKVRGWRWLTKPAMGRYAGSKAAIPSSAVTTEEYEEEAQRFAGGNDIDIKYRHFRDSAFFASYGQAMSESYARLTDEYALEELKVNATAGTLGSIPTSATDVPVGWVAVVDAALSMIEIGTPSFALVEKSVYREMFLTGTDKFLEFLNAQMGFEAGTVNGGNFRIVPVASSAVGDASSAIGLDVGEVLVGTKAAVKFRELGGGTPIRVDALNLVNGGVDEAFFGYAHCAVEDPRGVVVIDTNADGA